MLPSSRHLEASYGLEAEVDLGWHLLAWYIVSSYTHRTDGLILMRFPNSCVVAGAIRLSFAYKLSFFKGSVVQNSYYSCKPVLPRVTSALY